jgi:predicted glutamine amidotransferase
MCRVLAYLGEPIPLDALLYKPDSSLVRQSYAPRMLRMLNLAGFGLAAWDPTSHDPGAPFVYKVPSLPIFDSNLRRLAEKLYVSCLIAHVRGVPPNDQHHVGHQNLHPFRYDGFRIALAHNGDLAHFASMKFDLLSYIRPEIARRIEGTTDSEWIYALLCSQLADPRRTASVNELREAVEKTLRIIRAVRAKNDIHVSSSVNLFITDGESLVATRFAFDFGCYGPIVHEANLSYLSLWYTFGKEYGFNQGEWKMVGGPDQYDSVLIASEPLTTDTTTWLEVPEYSMLYVCKDGATKIARTIPLDV